MSEINIKGFSGANNIKDAGKFYSKTEIAEPRVILNADVDLTGSLIIREGRSLYMALPNAHSLWAGERVMLCAANGVLYKIRDSVATALTSIPGPDDPLSYVDAEDKVYISNQHWQGVLDPDNDSISAWGVDSPPGPMLLSGTGGLPAGTYKVTMTNVSGDELSGNGPISEITLSLTGGIQILNRPAGAIVWATDAEEYQFYLIGDTNKIVELPTVEPLPSFLCSPPPFMGNLCYAFGRIWGSSGQDVYYSLPFNLGWFRLTTNKYHFDSTVTMIAKVPTGLFIGMEKRTLFLAGTIPEQMKQQDAGAGSIKGTLAYCNNMPELGWTLGTPEKDFADVPVWLTTEGIVVGAASGHFFNVTKNKVHIIPPTQGASLYRNVGGKMKYLTNFRQGKIGSGVGDRDADTEFAFSHGHIDTHNEMARQTGVIMAATDLALCEVRRGGFLI
jgi:hypothetical protein